MKVSGFSYVRNGKKLDYPFVESVRSILPVCDEFIMVVGDSDDGSREAVEAIGSEKIKIVDTVWNMAERAGGKVFRDQANAGLDHCTGDWCFHIQADEIIHEKDLPGIRKAMEANLDRPEVQGLLFPYYHFWGYGHVSTMRSHRHEIRVVRNDPKIRSYKDSQGFRMYTSPEAYTKGERGEKLKVVENPARIYHYSRVRNPKLEMEKVREMHRFYHDDQWIEENYPEGKEWDYSKVDYLEVFNGTHPEVMQERVKRLGWKFDFKETKAKFHPKGPLRFWLNKLLGWRIGENKNYRLIK